ncbi:unnamed protein product [Nippostrongylus brasiliensis]|uniref:Chloride channel protein n=1 Tax=Nippostrongylus brasiliensis TaxID=27835 RepID=A0A0N4YXQ5_NIPBR|nr:unnamed protein product [Nippostrongylus brasiliensis]
MKSRFPVTQINMKIRKRYVFLMRSQIVDAPKAPGHEFDLLELQFMLLSDWIFLAVLGILVAFLSISVDMMIYYFQEVQSMTFLQGERFTQLPVFTFLLSFASWCAYTTGMVAASAAFVHYVSPQAIGSGIPEMKTIIRGVILKDYLTTRTLLSKVFGVAMSLGSGVPIGKMVSPRSCIYFGKTSLFLTGNACMVYYHHVHHRCKE